MHTAGLDENGDTILEATTRGFAEWNRHSAIVSIGIKLPAGSDGIVLVDPGPTTTLSTLTHKLQRLGASIESIRAILLTHIHLGEGNDGVALFVVLDLGADAVEAERLVQKNGRRLLVGAGEDRFALVHRA